MQLTDRNTKSVVHLVSNLSCMIQLRWYIYWQDPSSDVLRGESTNLLLYHPLPPDNIKTRKDLANSCWWLGPPRTLCLRYGFEPWWGGISRGGKRIITWCLSLERLAPTSGSSPRQVLLIHLKGHLHHPPSEKTPPPLGFILFAEMSQIALFF